MVIMQLLMTNNSVQAWVIWKPLTKGNIWEPERTQHRLTEHVTDGASVGGKCFTQKKGVLRLQDVNIVSKVLAASV